MIKYHKIGAADAVTSHMQETGEILYLKVKKLETRYRVILNMLFPVFCSFS